MNDEQFAAYRKRLENEVCDFMDSIEKSQGKKFDYIISHHAFTNAMTGAQILDRRRAEGNTKLKHFNFVHGTALKMYIKEKEGDPEYPMRFWTLTQKHGVFNGTSHTQGVWVNSKDYVDKFLDCFPTYPADRTVYSQIGVNQNTFRPKGTTVAKDLAQHIREEDKPKLRDVKKIVTFIGKFADWKRLDAVLHAAVEYEKNNPDLGTVIVGSGPKEAIEEYEGLAKKLGLKRTFFVGPKGQPILADILSMSEVGLFPSYKEPFGMVFVECMACGCPTIGAKSGGPVEFVKAAHGMLVDEQSDWATEAGSRALGKRLADAINQALKEDWKKTKGPGCTKFVEDNFSTHAQCHAMLADMKRWS